MAPRISLHLQLPNCIYSQILFARPYGVMADTADDAYVHRDSGKVVPDECISCFLCSVRGL